MSVHEMRAGQDYPHERREHKTLEPIPDEEMGNLLAAVGNSEAKAGTLLAMDLGRIYDSPTLYHGVKAVQGERPGWVMSRGTPFCWCEDSLAPIGFVTEEVIDSYLRTWGYIITEYGDKTGKPLAALLSENALETRTPLYRQFGRTASNSPPQTRGQTEFRKRAPLTRLKILRALARSRTPLRETDLADAIGEPNLNALPAHLNALKESGIVTYESRSHLTDFTFYMLLSSQPQEAPPQYKRYPNLTSDVWDFMSRSQGENWSATEVTYHLQHNKRYGEKYEGQQESNLYNRVSGVLNHLRKNGYLEVEKFDVSTQSQVSLTDAHRERLTNLVSLIDAFQARDRETWKRGRELARSLPANPEKMALLFAQAREASPYANKQPVEELAEDLFSLIQENPGSTLTEIHDFFRQKSNKLISRASVTLALKLLHDKGAVRREKNRGHSFRYLVS